ncbi:HNH endonuclease [Archaeoglobales archaeon]|nr:MAG: HNH endonuclease [Archaeoglobales archaeon]
MQREELARRLLEIQGGKCFICEEPIDLELHKWEIDHIIPRAKGGRDNENNYAVVHESCNRKKLDSDLRVARCMARYEKIKEKYSNLGPNRPNLGDFLREFGGAKHLLRVRIHDNYIEYVLDGATTSSVPLYKDKLSGMDYFFVVLPIEYIFHDERINPRAIGSRIKGLIEEFLAGRPQLHVSLAWAQENNGEIKVHVFDGQHKAAAQMLLGVRELPVRVFLNPDLDTLLVANTRAGTVLKQVAFDKSVQRFLGSQIYWEKIDQFRRMTNRSEDDLNFSEQDLLRFFRGEHREIKRYILDDVRTAVIHNPENRLKDYVEFSGRSKEKPLSYSTIEKTFFAFFINKEPMSMPLSYKLEVGENPRQLEKEQLVKLMNIVAEEIYVGKYDFDLGSYRIEEKLRKGEDIPDDHLRAIRLSREEILYNILRYVRDCIKRYYLMNEGKVIEDNELFQNKFPDIMWDHIRKVIRNIASLPIWVNRDPTISSAVFGGKQTYDFWKHVFDTGYTPSGVAVLPRGLNLDDLLT